MIEDQVKFYREMYEEARKKTRRELINETISTITHVYTEQVSETLKAFSQDKKLELPDLELKYGEKINAIVSDFNLPALSVEDRESILVSSEFFFQFGELIALVYTDFASALAKVLEINGIGPETTILFSGRDSLPLFIAAQNNEALKSYPVKWIKLGRRQINFLRYSQWWQEPPNVMVNALGKKLQGSTSTVVIDFGFRSSVDRTVLAYLEYLNKTGKLDFPKPSLKLSGLFYHGNHEEKLDFEDIRKYLSRDTPDEVVEIMQGEDAKNRTKVWGYMNNVSKEMKYGDSGIELPFFELSEGNIYFEQNYMNFLEALQETGASIAESTDESFYSKEQGRSQKSLPAKPLQISMGRLAFLSAIKKSVSTTDDVFSPENITALGKAFKQLTDYPKVFLTLFDSSRSEQEDLYEDPTIPNEIKNLQKTLMLTGKTKAST